MSRVRFPHSYTTCYAYLHYNNSLTNTSYRITSNRTNSSTNPSNSDAYPAMSQATDGTIQANTNTATVSAELLEEIRRLRMESDRHRQEMESMRAALQTTQLVARHADIDNSVRHPIDHSTQRGTDSKVHNSNKEEQHTKQPLGPKSYHRSDSDDERYKEAKLFSAINKGKLYKVQELLISGVKTDIIDKNNKDNSPLHYAVIKGHEDIVEELLLPNWRTNINARNNEGNTPLHIAAVKGHRGLVQLLLRRHAKLDIGNNEGQTPLELSEDQGIINAINHHLNSVGQTSVSQQQKQKRTEKDVEGSNLKKSKISIADEVHDSRKLKRSYTTGNKPETSGAKKVRISENYAASGLKSSLHGVIYQLKLLMIVLKRGLDRKYSFRLATEMDAAEKFDDLVFQYTEGGKKIYRFLQAKHKQDVTRKISLNDLLTETDGEFSLPKYFTSYRKIKQNPQFNGHNDEIKDFIICTNIDFKFGDKRGDLTLSDDIFDKERTKDGRVQIDDILKTCLLRFRNDFHGKKQIISILKNTSDLSKLVTKLAECLLDGKLISHDNSKNDSKGNLFRSYECALIKEVIDNESNKLRANFINAVNLSPEATNFRIAFEDFFDMRRKSFNFEDSPLIKKEDLTNFAQEVAAHIIKGRASKVVKIEKRIKVLRNNFDKLAGYVLIKNDGKIHFSSAFLNNHQLPGNLNIFRSELEKKLLKEAGLFQNLHHFRFEVYKDFKTCEEIYVDKKAFWEAIKERELKLFNNFGKIDTHLDSVEKFAEKMITLIEEREFEREKIVNIQRKDNVISKNIDKLIHILTEKNGKIQFSSEFLNDTKLPGNFNDLRRQLKTRFQNLGEYEFHISNFPRLNLPSDSIINMENDIESFLRHLVFAVNQPDEIELGNIIEAEMSADKEINLVDSDFIASKFQKEILDWMKEKKGRFLTHEDSEDLFVEVKKKLAKLVSIWPTLEYRAKIEELGITFRNTPTKLHNFLLDSSTKQIFNLISPPDTILGVIKVYQILKDAIEYEKDDSHVFISLCSLLRRQDHVLQAFGSPSNHLLVIECEAIGGDVQQLFRQLVGVITRNKKIILITQGDDPLADKFKDSYRDKYEEVMDGRNRLIDLTLESQDEILRKRKFIFQGEAVSLGRLINHKTRHLIDAELLSKLIGNEEIRISEPLVDLGDVKTYYIPRAFNRLVYIRQYLTQNTDQFFIIRDVETDASDLKRNQDIVLISDTVSHFQQLCDMYAGYNIHWLKEKGRVLLWQRSHGNLSKLREFIDQRWCKIPTYKPETITEIPEKIVIITAEPGMGKSTVLTDLSIKAKKIDPSLWVAKINLLVDCATELENQKVSGMELTVEKVIEFLTKATKLKTEFEKKLFKDCYNRGKLALFFDGYDEISPDYKEKFNALLRLLKISKVERLWVTTRAYNIRNDLEDTLSTFSYTLKEFSEEDQKSFFKNFWNKVLELEGLHNERSRIFIDELLHRFSQSIKDTERKFISIPLQTKMIADIFKYTFKEFHESDNDHLSHEQKRKISDNLELITLYENFLRTKFDEILFGEKAPGINKADYKMKRMIDKERKQVMEDHKKLAMCRLFGRDELEILLSEEVDTVLGNEESLLRYVEHSQEKTGIIDRVVDDKPVFVHQTFAEYFAAFWFTENWRRPEVGNFLKQNIFNEKYEVMRKFFDRMLCNDKHDRTAYEIHSAVLKNDELEVTNVLTKNGITINTTDKAGRTPLHLAAAYDDKVITENLLKVAKQLESTAILTVRDQIFYWTPLSYADKGGHWSIAELLLQNGADGDDMFEAVSSINNGVVDERATTLLHVAATEGYVKLAQTLVEKKADVYAVDQDGMTPLHLSTRKGRLNVVKYFVETLNVDLNIRDKDGRIPLFLAAEEGQLDVLKYFVDERKMDVSIKDACGTVCLHSAAKNGHLEIVEYLVNKGADLNIINTIGIYGHTPLHLAAQYGQLHVVKYLLNAGAEFSIVDDSTPLHWAALYGKLDVVQYLINEKIADIEAREYDGSSPLHLAATNGHLELVEWLVQNHSDLDARDNNDRIPLHLAAQSGKFKVVEYLIAKRGNNSQYEDKDGNTPLHLSARFPDVARFLIEERHVDFTIKNNNGQTLLHQAACADNGLGVVKYLVNEKNVHITSEDNEGSSPMHLAARYGRSDVVNYFFDGVEDNSEELSALLFDTEKYGMTPLHYAVLNDHEDVIDILLSNMRNNTEKFKKLVYGQESDAKDVDDDSEFIVKLLLEKGADTFMKNKHHTILHEAVRGGSVEKIKFILDKIRVDNENYINVPDIEGNTPLMWAAANNKPEAAEVLLEYGANVNAENVDRKTVLHLAVSNRHEHMVNVFIKTVDNIDARDKNDRTPLHCAAEEREWDILKLLVQGGAKVNAVDEDGRIVLHWAAADGNIDVVKFLAENNADCNFKDKNGNTPLHLAADGGELDTIKYLIEVIKVDFNTLNNNGKTPLQLACQEGKLSAINYLSGKAMDTSEK